jgi:hypothetical protein
VSHRDPDGDPTSPHTRAATNGVISGESTPPDEHTRRVEALRKQKDGAPNLKVHDDPEKVHKAFRPESSVKPDDKTNINTPVAAPASVIPATPMRSTELSERSRKQKKRERDRRAERTALGAVILIFLMIGGMGYWISSSITDDEPSKPPTPEEIAAAKAQVALKLAEKKAATTSRLDETPDLPALRMMMSEGLTIAAEGLPEVSASVQTPEAGVLAAIETCRFAYSVWEFSPNKRFRFLTTCEGKDGQILVGAYETSGSKVTLSPLVDGPAMIISELEVEKPSTMTTKVGYGPIVLDVKQRIGVLRGGMQGEAFRATYEPRNTLPTPGAAAKPKAKDPLLEAIQEPN